jgi:microcystin-dependent protein
MARNYSSISEVKTLAANVTEASTSLTINETTTGLPTVPFVFVINPDTALEEAVLATVKSGSTYTITRNIEGGGVKSHTVGQEVRHMIVGSDLQLVHNHLDNTTTAHGIDTKAPLSGPTFTGTVTLPSTTSIGNVSATELGYIDGVTSAIQTQLNALTAAVTAAVPTGVISPYAGLDSNIPTGYLLCNGQEVSRTTYATLFGVVSTTYGVGDNSTTFNLPDLRGRAPIGAGTGTGLTARALGSTVGTETHTLTEAQMPGHTHAFGFGGGTTGGAYITQASPSGTFANSTHAGSGQAHPNMQPSLALNFIIKS